MQWGILVFFTHNLLKTSHCIHDQPGLWGGGKSAWRGDKNDPGGSCINKPQTDLFGWRAGVYCYFASHHSLTLPEPSKIIMKLNVAMQLCDSTSSEYQYICHILFQITRSHASPFLPRCHLIMTVASSAWMMMKRTALLQSLKCSLQ